MAVLKDVMKLERYPEQATTHLERRWSRPAVQGNNVPIILTSYSYEHIDNVTIGIIYKIYQRRSSLSRKFLRYLKINSDSCISQLLSLKKIYIYILSN